MLVPDAEARDDCPETFRVEPIVTYPVAVMFVEETEAREDWPAVVSEPKVPLPEVLIVVPVAFVNVRRWRDESLVAVKVPTWKLPLPVAFVKVMFVEEMLATIVPALMFPARVRVPVAEIFACVLEFTWKLTKSPWKVELGFAPIYVPVVFEFWIGFRPN